MARVLAGFFKRFFARLFGKKAEPDPVSPQAPAFNVPAPQTLVARISTVAESDERKMIRLAEESLRRGFPEQAALAYRKAAKRFADEGKHLKRIAVLQQLAKVNRRDPSPYLELIEVYETIDRKRDADLARSTAAAIYRELGQEAEAVRLERQVAPRSLGRAVSMARTHAPPAEESEYEMPGDAVMANGGAPIAKIDVQLPPVVPVDLGAPTPGAPVPVPSGIAQPPQDQQPLTPQQIDASGAIELSLSGLDALDEPLEIDDEEGFDSIAEPPRPGGHFDDAATDAPSRPPVNLQGYPLQPTNPSGEPDALAIDDATTDSDGDLGAQTMAYESLDLIRDASAPTRSYSAIDAIQAAGGQTLAINPLPGLDDEDEGEDEDDYGMDPQAQTIAMSSVPPGMLPDDPSDIGAQTIAMSAVTRDTGAQTIAVSSIHDLEEDDEEQDDEDDIAEVGAQTIAMSPVDAAALAAATRDPDEATTFGKLDGSEPPPPAHTRPLPSRARFNILDAATQMDPTGVPSAVLGTKHEARARATSRVEKSKDEPADPSLADALNSKIGG